MTRVLVFSQSSVVRAGLESLVAASPALTLVGSLAGVAQATLARQIDESQPDVVLAELGGHEAAEALGDLLAPDGGTTPPALVILADGVQDSWTTDALRSGARAILPRDATESEIVAAVGAAAAGLVALHPALVEPLLLAGVPAITQSPPDSQHETLTPREIEVLRMIAEGLANKTIAYRLGISEHTVKFHVSSVFAKLGVSGRAEAVTLGIRQGFIML